MANRPIAPTATHSIRLESPVFSSAGDDQHFTINVEDGNFSTLWTGSSSAFAFDVGDGSTAACPGSTSLASYFTTLATGGAAFVRLVEHSTSSFTQGVVHGYNNTVPGDGSCVINNQQSSGAWINPGNVNDGVQQVPVDAVYHFDAAAEEFLNSQGALPTAINVTRNRGGRTPSLYVLTGTSETEFDSGLRRRWRLTYERQV